jgi:alkylation response protein AidB-like acyl-CoA dehydrogenase
VYLELTDEQGFLSEAAVGTLARRDTLAAAREALDGVPAPGLWALGEEAGWPGLLSAEQVDGTELGAYEAILVLEACGARLADARLLGHLPAVALLELAGFADLELRRELALGAKRAALVDPARSTGVGVISASDRDDLQLDGTAPLVLDGDGADLLVVVYSDGGQERAAVVDPADPEVLVTAQPSYDATRALATITLNSAPARPLALTDEIQYGRNLQRALLAAESVGAAEACMTMARDYALERQAFGRTIGSYQSIKHRLVEMMRRLENGRSLLIQAGRAWQEDPHEFALQANAARVIAADALTFAAAENIFIHGGIGATWEHDAQLYYRRAEVSRRLAGGAGAGADAVADLLLDTAA